MKIPERIVGLLEDGDTSAPFEFDKNTFDLRLYRPDKDYGYEKLMNGVKALGSNLKEHKWIDSTIIKGKTSEGLPVYFGTSDNPSSYHGYLTYSIDWFYITNNRLGKVEELRVFGSDVNRFYDSSQIFEQEIRINENDPMMIESMKVETKKHVPMYCGSYLSVGHRVDITCVTYATMHVQKDNPLESRSYMRFRFAEPVDLEELISKARIIKSFFNYICYRTNNDINDIATYITLENGKRLNCGKLVFRTEHEEETHKKANERIIKADSLGEHVAELFETIEKGELPYGHYCESISNTLIYPTSRIIMILSAFEREFRNIYGQDVRRADEYKQIKSEVIKLIEGFADTLGGKQRKYAKGFAKGIKNSDSSYGDNLKFALEDCRSIMEPFITRRFEGSYEEIINDISININEIRNGIAHSRLDLELEARNLVDIQFVEEMLYAIRLKKIGIDKTVIQRAINELFGEGVHI